MKTQPNHLGNWVSFLWYKDYRYFAFQEQTAEHAFNQMWKAEIFKGTSDRRLQLSRRYNIANQS